MTHRRTQVRICHTLFLRCIHGSTKALLVFILGPSFHFVAFVLFSHLSAILLLWVVLFSRKPRQKTPVPPGKYLSYPTLAPTLAPIFSVEYRAGIGRVSGGHRAGIGRVPVRVSGVIEFHTQCVLFQYFKYSR